MYTELQFQQGQLILIDKPLYWSSFQAVNKIKWAIRKKLSVKKIKIGHAGTLDPMATGLLLICTGASTKKIQELQHQEKEYKGTLMLGVTTPSYDMETSADHYFETAHITPVMIRETAQQFLGEITQCPPIFSALKKDGRRLYEYAREGKNIIIPPRNITITVFEITKIAIPEVYFRVCCSKGTYIRTLAHDFGKALRSGAYLSALRRTKIGNYHVEDAITPEAFVSQLPQ